MNHRSGVVRRSSWFVVALRRAALTSVKQTWFVEKPNLAESTKAVCAAEGR